MRPTFRVLVSLLTIAAAIPSTSATRRRTAAPGGPGSTGELRIETTLGGVAGLDGTVIEINGKRVGVTASNGTFQATVKPGTVNVRAFVPSLAEGVATVQVGGGKKVTLQVPLLDAQVVENATLVADQVQSSILPVTFTSFSVHFQTPAGTRPAIRRIDAIEVSSAFEAQLGLSPFDLRSWFVLLNDGTIALLASRLENFRDVLKALPQGPAVVRIAASDADNATYSAEAVFALGQYKFAVMLLAPPSNPKLGVTNRDVDVAVLNTPVRLLLRSDSHGRISALLPAGAAALDLEIIDGGRYYYARTSIAVSADIDTTVTILGVADLQQGVNSVTPEPAGRNVMPAEPRIGTRHPRARSSAITCDVSVVAESEDQRVTGVTKVSVPKGTASITLRYIVDSAEYPTYVVSQSVYDDVWELQLFASDGRNLFGITRQVNSQLYGEPVWQSDGTTGTILRDVDVSALTKNAATELTLFAASTNIGDGALATSVCAAVTPGSELSIESAEPDGGGSSGVIALVDIAGLSSSNSVFSIPKAGSGNTYAVNFAVRVTPDTSAVKHVKVELFDASGSPLGGPVLDVADTSLARIDAKTFRVPVTMTSANPSKVDTVPPPATHIYYRFTVSNDKATASRESSVWKALWRWPGDALAIPRFSTRDTGGDDWCSRGTYQWIEAHADLLRTTAVNDISGEHGRNIGHTEHKRGTDLDLFHFTSYTTSGSGTANFYALRNKVLAAIDGNGTAKGEVTAFFTTARNRLATLRAMTNVRLVISGRGAGVTRSGSASLPTGWMETLLVSGKITGSDGKTLLDIGSAWSAATSGATLLFKLDHDNHVHVGLNENKIDP